MTVMTVAWKHIGWGANGSGIEYLLLRSRSAQSVVVWVDDRARACHLTYTASWNDAWAFERIAIQAYVGGATNALELRRAQSGVWTRNGQPAAHLDGCHEVDLWPTPFTNTLPLRRLNLDVGGSATIGVAYVEAPALTVSRREQRYTNLGGNVYRFGSLDDGFTADILVDDAGVVVQYPALFERLI